MMTYFLYDREVEVVSTEIEIGEGCYVNEANWVDTGEPLTDDEIGALENKYSDTLYQEAYEHAASDAYDRAKDRWKYGE